MTEQFVEENGVSDETLVGASNCGSEGTSDAHTSNEARSVALVAAHAANEKRAIDITVQDVRSLTSEVQYFVSVTAKNDKQAHAIAGAVEDDVRQICAVKPHHRETKDITWQLLDFGDVVVHIFSKEAREKYKLEELWEAGVLVNLKEQNNFDDMEYSARIEEFLNKNCDQRAQ